MIKPRIELLFLTLFFMPYSTSSGLPPALESVNAFICEVMDTSYIGSPPWIKCAMDTCGNAYFIYEYNGLGFGSYFRSGAAEHLPEKMGSRLLSGTYERSYNRILADDIGDSHLFLSIMPRGDFTLDKYLYAKINAKGAILSKMNIDLVFELVDLAVVDGQVIAIGFSIPGLNKDREYFILKINKEGSKYKKYRIKTKEKLHHSSHNSSMYIIRDKKIMLVSRYRHYDEYPEYEYYVNKTIIDIGKNRIVKNDIFPIRDSLAILWPGFDPELDWDDNTKMKFNLGDSLGYFSILPVEVSEKESSGNCFAALLFDQNGGILQPEERLEGNVLFDNLGDFRDGDIIAKNKWAGRHSGHCPEFMIISLRDFPNLIFDYGDIK